MCEQTKKNADQTFRQPLFEVLKLWLPSFPEIYKCNNHLELIKPFFLYIMYCKKNIRNF